MLGVCVNNSNEGFLSTENQPLQRCAVESNLQCMQSSLTSAEPLLLSRSHFDENNLVLGEVIRTGSFGTIRLASYFGDTVVVKTLLDSETGSNRSQLSSDELMQEAFIVERKKSEYLIRLYHYSPEKKYLVTDYCKHGTLYEVLHRDDLKPVVLDWNRRLTWLIQVALAMNIAHNHPPTVLHRDLKSSNVFIDEHWTARVGDFAAFRHSKLNEPFRERKTMLEHLRLMWQAPEVLKKCKYSTKSDVYCFGALMHELLVLSGPRDFTSKTKDIVRILEEYARGGCGFRVPVDRSALPGKWTPCLEEYIDLMYECCSRFSSERPEFDEISDRLKAIQTNYSAEIQQEKERSRLQASNIAKMFSAIGAVFCLFALVVFLAKYWISWRGTDEDNGLLVSASVVAVLGLCILVSSIAYNSSDLFKATWISIRNQVAEGGTSIKREGWQHWKRNKLSFGSNHHRSLKKKKSIPPRNTTAQNSENHVDVSGQNSNH